MEKFLHMFRLLEGRRNDCFIYGLSITKILHEFPLIDGVQYCVHGDAVHNWNHQLDGALGRALYHSSAICKYTPCRR